MPDLLLDEDDFRLACNVVYAWRNATDGTDPQLIDLIARAIGADRARVDTLEHQAGSLQALAEDLEARLAEAPLPAVISYWDGVRFDWVPRVGWRRSPLDDR